MTGYKLDRSFESTACWAWTAPQSQTYPQLKKLEVDGQISGEDERRGKRLWPVSNELTDEGLAALRRWLTEAHAAPNVRDRLLLKALFFDLAEPDAVRACWRIASGSSK